MRVGIFADSYGAHKPGANGLPWTEMLQKTYSLDVENHSKSASSVWYSYNQFKMHQHKYDKIVFLVTGQDRTTIPIPSKYSDDRLCHVTAGHIDGFKHIILNNKEYQKDAYLRNIAVALEKYYMYLHDHIKDFEVNKLMYEEIKRVRPDALIIPCFKNSVTGDDISLWDIHEIDIKYYNLMEKHAVAGRENRHCHMNQENNAILAEKINKWVNGQEFVLYPSHFTTPTKPVDYYFLKD
jgi:hypothetical protein